MSESIKSEPDEFNYEKAFCRNIGWLSQGEQQLLGGKRVAIAGMGGVGGVHLLCLVRMGIQHFHIADCDNFEQQNFNRQSGATINSLGKSKVETMAAMAKEINPLVEIKIFDQGVYNNNLDEFLDGVHLYVDGLDFFALDIREQVFNRCYKKNIPAITAAPLGMGTAYLICMPGKMSFAEYFNFDNIRKEDKKFNFIIGLNPKMNNRHYLVDKSSVNFNLEKGPSTVMACNLSAGVMGVESLKILLNRGKIYAIPHYHLFDAYQNKHVIGWMPWGNRNPVQRLKKIIMQKIIQRFENEQDKQPIMQQTKLDKILELARWAPSGDNEQPWRFKKISESEIEIRLAKGLEENLYDYAGIPTMISMGCLLETIKTAATLFQNEILWKQKQVNDKEWVFTIKFLDTLLKTDILAYFIRERSVDRRIYKKLPLDKDTITTLTKTINEHFELLWLETPIQKWKMASINALATKIRMKIPELFHIHKNVFIADSTHPETGIPVNATGIDPLSRMLLKWGIKKQKRMNLLGRLGAIFSSQIELDYLPGIFSGAHFMLLSKRPITQQIALEAGQIMQRFWLTATQYGLVMQPSFAPMMITYYQNKNISYTKEQSIYPEAERLKDKLTALSGAKDILFMGRIGYPAKTKNKSRSHRLQLTKLFESKDLKNE